MEDVIRLEIDNLKKRLDKVENTVENHNKRLNDFDITQQVLITNLENIRQQLDRVEKKTDTLLGHTGADVLNEDKAKKWDKMVWLVVGEAVAILGLVIKVFVGF